MADKNQTNCNTDCKFCILHKVGVFVVNGVGLLLISGILLIYWRDVYYYCSGQSKPATNKEADSPTPPQATTIDDPTVDPENQPVPITVNDLPKPPVTPAPPSPDNQQPFQAIPTQTVDRKHTDHRHHSGHHAKPQISPDNKATKTFKEVTDRKTKRGIRTHESTGSNYFKQMMRGKKPVASISQYLTKRHKKDHTKKDGHRRRTPKHKK